MKNIKLIHQYRQELKRRMTESEKIFESRLKNGGINYKKQMIFGFYILDFCLSDKLLNIEIDGTSHEENSFKDKLRDNFVRKCGFSVLRIKNEDVKSFDLSKIYNLSNFLEKDFRHSLGMANAFRGNEIRKLTKQNKMI